MRTNKEITECYEKYADTVYRVAYLYMKNMDDAEDMMQNVFEKYIDTDTEFHNENHLKAWLITVTKNTCLNNLRSVWKSRRDDWEQVLSCYTPTYTDTYHFDGVTFREIKKLKKHYQVTLYLFYYEGYPIKEIASIMEKPESTIQTWLSAARRQLKKQLGGMIHEEIV